MSSGIVYGTSWLELCNRALGRIGVGRVSSLDSGDDSVQKLITFLGEAIETVLSACTWHGLRSRTELARLVTPPAFGYAYQYQLPNDFVNPVKVLLDDSESNQYEIEGTALLTDATTVKIVYVPRPSIVSSMPGYLKTAIEAQLAALCAPSMRSDEADKAIVLAKGALDDAIAEDGRRAPPEEAPAAWTNAR